MLLSPDGRWLAMELQFGGLRILDLKSGRECPLKTSKGFEPSSPLAFSPDGQFLVIEEVEGEVSVWDLSTGESTGRLIGKDLKVRSYWPRPSASWSPDGRFLALADANEVSLWDTRTVARVRTLGRSRGGLFAIVFSGAILGWAVVWGMVARKRRQQETGERPWEAEPASLAPIAQAVLRPLHVAAGYVLRTAAVAAMITPLLAVLVRVRTVADLVGVFLIVLGVLIGLRYLRKLVPLLSRSPHKPYAWELERASSVAGWRTAARYFGPVRAFFFGPSQIVSAVEEEFEAVRGRFSQIVGHAVEPRDRLLVLVFRTNEEFYTYLRGYSPLAGYFVVKRNPQIIMCAEAALDRLIEPVSLLRLLLSYYFLIQYKRFVPHLWVFLAAGHAAAGGLRPEAQRRIHRGLRVWQMRDAASREPDLFSLPHLEAMRVVLRGYERGSFRRSFYWTCQMASLAQYLLTDPTGRRAEGFRDLLRTLKRIESVETSLVRHFGCGSQELVRHWHEWALEQPIEPHDDPPPDVEEHLVRHVSPLVATPTAPMARRAEAIRHVGASGYLAGVETLIDLLENHRAQPLHEDAVWALETIAGRSYGPEAARWRQWYQECRDGKEAAAGEPAAAEVQQAGQTGLAGQDASSEVGRFCERQEGAETVRLARRSGFSDWEQPVPKALKNCWALFILGGAAVVIWSVVFWLGVVPEVNTVATELFVCAHLLAGVFAVTRGTGAQMRGLKTGAALLLLTSSLCNIVGFAAGIAIALLLRSQKLKGYLAAMRL